MQVSDHQIHDPGDLILGQGLVEYDVVQPVQKLRAELLLQKAIHHGPGLPADLSLFVDALQNVIGA